MENSNHAVRTKAAKYARKSGFPYYETTTEVVDDTLDDLFEAAVS